MKKTVFYKREYYLSWTKRIPDKELQDKEHEEEKHIGEHIKKSLKMKDTHFRYSLNHN